MTPATTEHLLHRLGQLFPADQGAGDRQLLDRFTAARDEAAFTALLLRHGPMVLGVCRRLLGDGPAAEDAFQATFLSLAREAASVRRRDAVGGWLHGVARRLALKARAEEARRRQHEHLAGRERPPDAGRACQELLALLDEELQRLPECLRAPLRACYLEGRTQDEAARQLGWSLSTLRRRLGRGRELLRRRLARHGVALSAGLFAAALAPRGVAVPPPLARATLRAAVERLALPALTGAWVKAALALALVLGAAGAWALQPGGPAPAAPDPPAARPARPAPPPDVPLPPGAVARMGSPAVRHTADVKALAFSPDGKWLASASYDGSVRLWERPSGREVRRFTVRPHHWPHSLAFSPDGKRLAAAGGFGRLYVWEVPGGKVVAEAATEGKWWVFAPAFLADGRAAFLHSGDKGFALYDALSGRAAFRFEGGRQGEGRELAVSPDGRTLAISLLAGDADSPVGLFDLGSGRRAHLLEGHRGSVNALAFSGDGRLLASSAADGTALVWEAATGRELGRFPAPLGESLRQKVALSPDGRTLAVSGHPDFTVRLFDVPGGKELRRLRGLDEPALSLAFAPDGRKLAAGGNCVIRLWDVATGRPDSADRPGHERAVHAVAYSADGRTLVSGSEDGTARLWEARTGRQLRVWPGLGGRVYAVDLSPDGRSLAVAVGGRALVLDAASGGQRFEVAHGRDDWRQWAAFSPDGRLLAAMEGPGTVCLRDAAGGKVVRRLVGPGGEAGRLAFAPDGRLLAVCLKGSVRLWDVATGRMHGDLEQSPHCYLLAFSPDGRALAAGTNGTLGVWSVDTLRRVGAMKALPEGESMGDLLALAFAPDGRTLVTSTWTVDGSETCLRVWETATGRERFRARTPGAPVRSVAFAPDGRTLATANADTTVTVWDVASLPSPLPAPAQLSQGQLKRRWADLAGADAAGAYVALRTLVLVPRQSLPLLGRSLRPVPRADGARVVRLLADLDSEKFPVRERATEELARLGEAASAALRAAGGRGSAEMRRRVAELVERLESRADSPDALREARAVEVLEWLGDQEARRILGVLAGGAEGARLTGEARAALRRLRGADRD